MRRTCGSWRRAAWSGPPSWTAWPPGPCRWAPGMFWGRGRCPRHCPGTRLAYTPGSCPLSFLPHPKPCPWGCPTATSCPLGTQNTALGEGGAPSPYSSPGFPERLAFVLLSGPRQRLLTVHPAPSPGQLLAQNCPGRKHADPRGRPGEREDAELRSPAPAAQHPPAPQHGEVGPGCGPACGHHGVPAQSGAAGGRKGRSNGKEVVRVWSEGFRVLSPFLRAALPPHGGGPSVGPAGSSDAHPLPPTSVKPATRSRPVPGRGRRKAPLCPPRPPSRSATW